MSHQQKEKKKYEEEETVDKAKYEEEKTDKKKSESLPVQFTKRTSDSSPQNLAPDPAIKNIYFVINCPIYIKRGQNPKEIVEQILKKIEKEGCRDEHKEQALKNIKVVFGLNRSRTSQDDEWGEIDKNIESKIGFKIINFFWIPRGDEKRTPMREIRQRILESKATEDFLFPIRFGNPHSTIYFMTIDGDTVDFNKVFSSYIDHILECSRLPAVMTTGYEFVKDMKTENSKKAWFSSRIDRVVRLSTTRLIPYGAYYPEPNLCILVEELPFKEKFCSKKEGEYDWNERNCSLEAPLILRQVKKRENKSFAFLDKPPLITATPIEVINVLNRENTIKKLRQNHFHPRNWAQGLFWNKRDETLNSRDLTHITGKLQSFFTTLGAQAILKKKSWIKDQFENFAFTQTTRRFCKNLKDIVSAARISQINALLALLAWEYPLKQLEDEIISSEGIIFFLAFYLMNFFKDEELLRGYVRLIDEDFESLQERIQIQNVKFKKLPTAQDLKTLKEILWNMFNATSSLGDESDESQISSESEIVVVKKKETRKTEKKKISRSEESIQTDEE